VTAGDFTARVETPRTHDEIGTLANTFNRMTERIEEQTSALVRANNQIETRRALIEAVLSGISAGVIAVGPDRHVTVLNGPAGRMLETHPDQSVGKQLALIAPELDELLKGNDREAVIQLIRDGETRTLAVMIARNGRGYVLTFDDITQQLADQRRAAWADVARRIAHEIKNPLTPIQLAAERLQRRYGKHIVDDSGTFERLTSTIVRQVGDLRRMVDEFSSFARMPKPLFREEIVTDIARQALFLHEVAHPNVRFLFDSPSPPPVLVCDRRQLSQAFINIVKNAVEAIESKESDATGTLGTVAIRVAAEGHLIKIMVSDDGTGLPAERERLTEPYMTTRARGTGLGLAIVKKIIEEHFGTIAFQDRPGGGTVVTVSFDADALSQMSEQSEETREADDASDLSRSSILSPAGNK
jgi:two-component system nitrogen regulation sensor histidine kinase NtrY